MAWNLLCDLNSKLKAVFDQQGLALFKADFKDLSAVIKKDCFEVEVIRI